MGTSDIFLGFQTALLLQRFIDPSRIIKRRGRSKRNIPSRAPQEHVLKECRANLRSLLNGQIPEEHLTLHLLTSENHGQGNRSLCHVHPTKSVASAPHYQALGENLYVASPELALAQVARQLTRASLLELMYQVCGSYWAEHQTFAETLPTIPELKRCPPLSSSSKIARFCRANPTLHGVGKLKLLLPYMADGSASPMESKLAIALALPTKLGGAGFGAPHMNYVIECNESQRTISGRREFHGDLVWPARNVIIEYQSKEHHRNERAWSRDSRRMNALIAAGYVLYYITPDQLYCVDSFSSFVNLARKSMGLRDKSSVPNLRERRMLLWHDLGIGSEEG